MKQEPSTNALPPCRSAVARTIARPRPEPERSCSPRQKRSNARSRSAGSRPGPSSQTETSARSPDCRTRDRDRPFRRAVEARVLHQVRDRPLERRPVATHAHRLGSDDDSRVAVRERGDEPVERDVVRGRRCRLLPADRDQVAGEPYQAVGVLLEVRDQLRRGAMPGQVGDVALQRGQRRAQLVRGIGDQAMLGLARSLEAAEHRVQRRRKPAHLVVDAGLGQPPAGIGGALDLGRRRRRAASVGERRGPATAPPPPRRAPRPPGPRG